MFKWDDDPVLKGRIGFEGKPAEPEVWKHYVHTRVPAELMPGVRKPRSGTATQRTKTSNILKNEPLIPFTATICSTEQRP